MMMKRKKETAIAWPSVGETENEKLLIGISAKKLRAKI